MKMAKKAISAALAATLIMTPVAAFAEGTDAQVTTTTSTTTEVNTSTDATTVETDKQDDADLQVGLTPDSFFYFFKQLARDINLMITFDKDEEAELLLKYANEKAAELRVLSEQGNLQYNEEQMAEIEALLLKAAELLADEEQEPTDGDTTEPTDGDTTEPTDGGTTEPTDGGTTEPSDGGTTPTEPTDGTTPTEGDTTTPPAEEEQDGKMGPEHALVVLKALLEKLPEQGRKGVENAIKQLEKNIEKKQQKLEKKLEKKKKDGDTTEPTPMPEPTPTPEPTPAPEEPTTTVPSTGVILPETNVEVEAGTETAPAETSTIVEGDISVIAPVAPQAKTEVKTDNGLHLGHEKQAEKDKEKKNQGNNGQANGHAKQEGKGNN